MNDSKSAPRGARNAALPERESWGRGHAVKDHGAKLGHRSHAHDGQGSFRRLSGLAANEYLSIKAAHRQTDLRLSPLSDVVTTSIYRYARYEGGPEMED